MISHAVEIKLTYIKRLEEIKTPNLNQTTKSFFKVILSPMQRLIFISAFYLHFISISSSFQPHFSILTPFQFSFSFSVSTIQFQRFISTPCHILYWPLRFCQWRSLIFLTGGCRIGGFTDEVTVVRTFDETYIYTFFMEALRILQHSILIQNYTKFNINTINVN